MRKWLSQGDVSFVRQTDPETDVQMQAIWEKRAKRLTEETRQLKVPNEYVSALEQYAQNSQVNEFLNLRARK